MTSGDLDLADLQRWLLAAIMDPVAPPQPVTDQLLSTSPHQSAAERLAIYRSAYLARLLEVLREQFPATRFAVGDELFDQFAAGYLQSHTPSSYTLARLADNLVDHLEATRPVDWGDFLVELARLEQAIDRVFDAPGPENLPAIAIPSPADESLKLTLVPGFELLTFRYPASTFYTAWKAGQQPEWPQPRPQFVAVLRRDYIVRRHVLIELQYSLLLSLSRGSTLGEAVATAASTAGGVDSDELAAALGDWFAAWSASGFFAAAS